jgi:hypothetical protein
MKKILIISLIFITSIIFSGCSKYYSTVSHVDLPVITKKQVPVKIKLTQEDWSIVVKLSDEVVKRQTILKINDNPLFVYDENATNTLIVHIKHSNENGAGDMMGAVLTGASFYIIPSTAKSDVTILISLNGLETIYKGEIGVAQGLAKSSMIDKEKYEVSSPAEVLMKLTNYALDEFTIAYLKNELN